MEEPNRGIDTDPESAPALVISLEAIDDGEVCERAWLTNGPYDLFERV
jgi:hypothetical protein